MGSLIGAAKVSCVILTAGRSERMNSPKAFLRFSEEENFLQHIIRIYRCAGINNIIVVINPQMERDVIKSNYEEVKWVVNPVPELGRMSSLKTGLGAVENKTTFIQNIDNPFVTADCIKQLLASDAGADYVVPVYQGKGGHPVLLSDRVIRHIIKEESDDSKLNEVLKKFRRADVNMNDESVVFNINTPLDYEKYFLKREINAG